MSDSIPSSPKNGNSPTEFTYIYALLDPRVDPESIEAVRYIGKANDPHVRYLAHLNDKTNDFYKCRWIRHLQSQGLKPTLVILEKCPMPIWQERECHWISSYRQQGAPLTNTSLGGRGGSPMLGKKRSPESREKMRLAHLGKKNTPEQKARHAEVMAARRGTKMPRDAVERAAAKRRGQKRTPEQRARFSQSHRGYVMPSEQKEKIAAAHRGRKHSPEAAAKTAAAQRGKYVSPESREKMRLAHLGKKNSPEAIAKTTAALRGRKLSPEHKANLSLAAQRRKTMKNASSPDTPTLWDNC